MNGIGDARDETVECRFNVVGYRRIAALINIYGRCGVRHLQMADAAGATGITHRSHNLVGDVLHLCPARGPDGQHTHAAVVFRSRFHPVYFCSEFCLIWGFGVALARCPARVRPRVW